MSKRDADSIPPTAQSANKQRRTSTPAFRLACQETSSSGKGVSRTLRLTTIKTNALGRRGHLTESRSSLPEPEFSQISPSVNEELPGEGVPDSLLLDPEQLDDNLQKYVPSKPPKPKGKQQNTTLVCFLSLISEQALRTIRRNYRNGSFFDKGA